MTTTAEPWEFWIDVGGTFTDCFARRPDGTLVRHKLLSSGVVKGTVATGSTRRLDRRSRPLSRSAPILERLAAAICSMPWGRPSAAPKWPSFARAKGVCSWQCRWPSIRRWGAAMSFLPPARRRWWRFAIYSVWPDGQPVPPVRVRLGTTRGTNALLTRRGAPRRWSPPGASATCCRSVIRTGQKSSSWPSTSRLRCRPPRSRSTSGSPPTARFCSSPTRRPSTAS